MIPEWKKYFDLKLVGNFAIQLAGGNLDNSLYEKILESCEKCHDEQRISVWVSYHWGNFDTLKVYDSKEAKHIAWKEFMTILAKNFNSLFINIQENEINRALGYGKKLESMMGDLRKACRKCHSGERRYFVNDATLFMLSDALDDLEKPNFDMKRVQASLGGFGQASCYRCHLVHVPSAEIKERFEGK